MAVPLSHTLLSQPQGGLGAMQPPPQGGAMPPFAMQKQQSDAALMRDAQDDNLGMLMAANDISDQQFAQALRQRLLAGLPSSQEIGRAQQVRQMLMMQQLGQLAPTKYSGVDTLAAGLTAAASNPALMQQGNFGAFLATAGQGAVAARQKFEDRELAKATAAYNVVDRDVDTQEKRMFDALTKAQRLASMMGGAVTRQLPDGTIIVLDKATGNEIQRIGPNESKQFASFFEIFMKLGAEKGEFSSLDQVKEWATKQASVALAKSQGAAGATIVSQAQAPALSIDETTAVDSAMLRAMPAEDRATAMRLINRYQMTPNAGTKKAMEQGLAELVSRINPAALLQAPEVLPRKDVVGEASRTETAKKSADIYAASFDENVLKPATAMSNTGKIMQDFNNLGKMQYALKAGKIKEFMAGDTGKWALSFLPQDSDLSKGIANAQEAEKLTAQMVNQILLAAKGVQTEGDAQRARSQITQIGSDPDANAYVEAYVTETARQLKMREKMGREHKNKTGTYEGYDDAWQASPIMTDAKGSVKKIGSKWIGLTQYIDKFRSKYPSATDNDAVASWNRM